MVSLNDRRTMECWILVTVLNSVGLGDDNDCDKGGKNPDVGDRSSR